MDSFGVRKCFLSKSKLDGKVKRGFTYCKECVQRINKRNHLCTHHQDEGLIVLYDCMFH
jgi:hypothetical protein